MHAKNQDRFPRKISRKRQFFSTGSISVSHHFMPYFHFRCVAHATFDRNLIHSGDTCFLVMACVAYSRAQLKTLLSLKFCSSNTRDESQCFQVLKWLLGLVKLRLRRQNVSSIWLRLGI